MQECVDRGVEWLDKNHPDWLWRVNLNVLSLSNCSFCVLGQLCGWTKTLCFVYQKRQETISLGFALPVESTYSFELYTRLYAELTEAWKATITRLRAERSVEKPCESTAAAV